MAQVAPAWDASDPNGPTAVAAAGPSIAEMRAAFVRSRLRPRVDAAAVSAVAFAAGRSAYGSVGEGGRPSAESAEEFGGPSEPLALFFRALDAASDRRTRIFCPRANASSFDERWLRRLFERILADDLASARLLIGGRVRKACRRTMLALAIRTAQRLNALAEAAHGR